MKNQVQLIAYADRLAGGLKQLKAILRSPLKGAFGSVHLLPFFVPIDGADAGFDPVDHTEVDPRLGDWGDIRALSEEVDLMADLIVNHISSDSPQFKDFARNGSNSPFAGMFMTYNRVFPLGAREQDLARIYRPRPGLPFTGVTLQSSEKRLLWTTFTPRQIDIDVQHPQGRAYLSAILNRFQSFGIRMVRLDAIGYAIKKAGTSCFMIPETYRFIASLASEAQALGIEVLVEIHSHYSQQLEIARQVDWVYDYALPPLILHSLFARNARALVNWLRVRPNNAVTVLDTHDGVGVIDVGQSREGQRGLLTPDEIDSLVETIHSRSGGQSRLATGVAANNLDVYQVNSTFYDAMGRRGNEYLVARAIQFFVPGIPQVYYVGLLAGTNDMDLLARTQVGRDINRHYYTASELQEALGSPLVRNLLDLIRLRNTHPCFRGKVLFDTPSDQALVITWRIDVHWAKLEVDFSEPRALVTYSKRNATHEDESVIGKWESWSTSAIRSRET
ncbi:MAG TPA: sucrose phosphorylase [Candidatus Acidoferrales bacterium]|nr:sucrose phosphorylase [Candidatus Acidoferrales bacterium]